MLRFKSKKIAFVLVGLGLTAWLTILVPILIHYLFFVTINPLTILDPSASVYPNPIVLNVLGLATSDFTQASTWFENTLPPQASNSAGTVKYYSISIPKLKMSDVSVEVYGSDLKKNAIQYPGTALPGSPGNPVVFGHSALPQFYQARNPLTIFNPLTKIAIGDEILVNYDGIIFRYRVRQKQEVTPTDIYVLAQRYDKRELTLITCVPLGTYFHRLVVRAELIN